MKEDVKVGKMWMRWGQKGGKKRERGGKTFVRDREDRMEEKRRRKKLHRVKTAGIKQIVVYALTN